MYNSLIEHINKFAQLNAEEAELITKSVSLKIIKKKDFLLKPGQVCKSNYFVIKGCLRLYFINRKETEHITQFAIENWWITDQDSFDHQLPSDNYLQAVENTTVIVLEKAVLDDLFIRVPQLERYFRLILQMVYTAWQRRIKYIYNQTDEERYRLFSQRFPEFMQRVPQYMIASYLGFTPQFLSKIRAKK
ncbi:Crp/Fnr family transcriptional regulator [Mucilaginibacter paludis]|uniref:Transcriptional regulator, Crp/Fnr family n=1 Tax=Mucilaginibacter paludis DSM 18603 TaxID=714943 RepID=H1Y105_9SPHI|nr:Crp/Fnr family transcriptional regulator [Mucilaginibacter paludis]EHQ29230.1 putative transcriptional regulator, Crp/Fnr family [Mucilaginibacter paludis DSM 18603]